MLANIANVIRQTLAQRQLLLRWTGWFFASNILLFWLIGLSYLNQIVPLALSKPNFINEFLAWSSLGLAFFSHLALLALLPAILIILVTCLWPKPPIIFPLAIVTASFAALLLLSDALVFAKFRFHLNHTLLVMFFNQQMQEVFNLSWLEWLLAGLFFFGLLLLETSYAIFLWQKLLKQIPPHWGKRGLGTLACVLLLSYYMFALSGIYPLLAINKETFALPLYDNFFSYLLPTQNSFQKIMENGAGNYAQLPQSTQPLKDPLQPLIFKPSASPQNIVMIIIDTWRFDMLDPTVTPHVYQFAQSSWQFLNHFSGGNSTEPGLFSLFYSLPASYWTATLQQHRGPLFIDALLKQNYQMGIFASAELLSPAFNRNVFIAIKNLKTTTPGNNAFQRDRAISSEFQQFIRQAGTHKQPFFAFLFYDSAHSYCDEGDPIHLFQPAVTVCNHFTLTNQTDPAPYFNRYKNALYFVDAQIQQDLMALKKQGLLKNTVIIITGDHGNEFNDNHLGYWEHASNFTHYQTQTPLLIDWPKQPPLVFEQQTSHYDIVPTLMTKLLGCQNPPNNYSIGKLLTNKKNPSYLLVNSYVNFGIIEKDRITTIYPTGDYSIDDLTGRPIKTAQLHTAIFMQALNDMQRYYER